MKRVLSLFLAVTLVFGAYGSAVLGCAGGSKSADFSSGSPQKGVVYYHTDHLGNAHLITDSQGNILREEVRYPYGLDRAIEDTANVSADYVYTGKEHDEETGLVYFGARYYSPEIGRWITPDPLFLQKPTKVSEYPLEANLYAYVRGNPVTYVDPDGFGPWALTGGAFDVFYGVPDSWYRYGGNLIDIPIHCLNAGINVAGYATYGADKVLGYAGTNLEEVGLYAMMVPEAGPLISASLRYTAAWVSTRTFTPAGRILLSERGAITIAKGNWRFGDLTIDEITQIQGVARESGVDIYVVGSAAKGTRGIKRVMSDIDYLVPWTDDLNYKRYSGHGTLEDLIRNKAPGPHEHGVFKRRFNPAEGPGIRFSPDGTVKMLE